MGNSRLIFLFDVLDRASSLDTTHRVARRIGETTDDAGLPLERALQGLVDFRGLVEVDDIDVTIGGANNQQLLAHVQGIHTVLRR